MANLFLMITRYDTHSKVVVSHAKVHASIPVVLKEFNPKHTRKNSGDLHNSWKWLEFTALYISKT